MVKSIKATIRDVADLAGVSTATVSRVVNGNTSVSLSNCEAVKKAMTELNYLPDTAAASLKTNRTHMIGYVTTDVTNPVFITIMSEIERILWEYNYTIMLCSSNNNSQKELSVLKLLMSKKVDGIIINSCGQNDDYIARISKHIPTVASSHFIDSPHFIGDYVESENVCGSYMMTAHLISRGHRKIGIISGPIISSSVGCERFEGFKSAMNSIGILVDDKYPYTYFGSYSIQDGYDGTKKLLEADDRPTALILTGSEIMKGALSYCVRHSIRIPEDISLITFGNYKNLDFLYVRPSYMENDLQSIGRKMAELILERIDTKETIPSREFRFPIIFRQGDTVKALE